MLFTVHRLAAGVSFALLLVGQLAAEPAFVSNTQMQPDTWIMGAGGGLSWINLPSNEYIENGIGILAPYGVPAPYNYDNYSVNAQQAGIFQYFFGYRWHRSASCLPYYSLSAQYTHFFSSNVSGEVTQFSFPAFENYNYKMRYTADLFTLNGKFDLIDFHSFLPYLSAGIGAIFNHINSYDESPLSNVTPRMSPGYRGNSDVKLAGTLGAGLDFIVNNHYWVTLGYEHVFQGNIRSGPGVGLWSNSVLNLGNVKMDSVFLVLTANFPQGFRNS